MAKRSEEITDDVRLNDLPRLKEILYSEEGVPDPRINVRIRFRNGAQGFPEISGNISGLLRLRCQRCLGALDWPLNLEFQLVVVESDADIEEVAEPFDTVVAGEHGIELAEVVEDEVLSSLPLAPAHERIADCHDAELLETKIVYEQVDFAAGTDRSVGKTNQPFAGLADMLKHVADETD